MHVSVCVVMSERGREKMRKEKEERRRGMKRRRGRMGRRGELRKGEGKKRGREKRRRGGRGGIKVISANDEYATVKTL